MGERFSLASFLLASNFTFMEGFTVPSRETRARQHREGAGHRARRRKLIRHNSKPKRVRSRDWRRLDVEKADGWDLQQSERIMPPGEKERRRAVKDALLAGEAKEQTAGKAVSPDLEITDEHGVVVEVSSGSCRVEMGGRTLLCTVRGALSSEDGAYTNVVAVGDKVIVTVDGSEQGVIESVLPRRSALARPGVFYGHLQQVIAANVDQVLVVASWREPRLWPELIDRYLIAAQRNNLTPVICVNKVDLAEDGAECRDAVAVYVRLGYDVIYTSAVMGDGIDRLRDVLRGRTTVLAGLSGVGKSSLLMAVQPGLYLRTAETSERKHEGRHTTTQVSMLRLEMGGFVVDTPGIREFGVSGLRRSELGQFYPEIAAATRGCRFRDCTHRREPGCAVRAAVRTGEVAEARLDTYRKIWEGLAE